MLSIEIVEDLLNYELRKFLLPYDFDQIPYADRMHQHVTFGTNQNELKIRADQDYFFIIRRSQPFSKFEKSIVYSIIKNAELFETVDIDTQKYLNNISTSRVISLSLLENLGGKKCEIISRIIETLEQWASQTYEGNRITCAIGVDLFNESHKGIQFSEFVTTDFSKVISNGIDTIVTFNREGFFIGYSYIENEYVTEKAPISYSKIAQFTTDNYKRIAIVLNRNGEILIFTDGALLFTKRRGIWQNYNHDALITKMAFGNKKMPEEIRRAVYESCLDVSFSRHGGCIGLLMKTKQDEFCTNRISKLDLFANNNINIVQEIDGLHRQQLTKTNALNLALQKKKFSDIDRKIRQEIIGIDGATIIDSNGNLIATGAILEIDKGSEGGARKAAAKCISKYGIGLKISADGEIIMYSKGNEIHIG